MLKVIRTPLFWRKAAAIAALALSLGLCAFAGQLQRDRLPVSGQADAVEVLCEHTLASFGWETSGLISQEQVTLPETFGATYEDFLNLQEEAGFHLSPYAGKTVTRYTYGIQNYPTGEDNVYADLLVYNRMIIGGDIRTASLDGFMTSLRYPDP